MIVCRYRHQRRLVEDYLEPNSSQTPNQFVDATAEGKDDEHDCDEHNRLHLGVDGFVCIHGVSPINRLDC